MPRRVLQIVLTAVLGVVTAVPLLAQSLASADDRPRFLITTTAGKPPVDASDAPLLRRRVTAELRGVTLAEALREVGRQTGIRFAMSRESVPVDKRVSLRATGITLGAALFELLSGLGLDVQFSLDGTSAAVVRRPEGVKAVQIGAITGRVTDATTGEGVSDVDIRVAGTQLSATTDDDGEYTLRDVPAGEQRVTARRIGYRPQMQTVTVVDGEVATLDFALVNQPTQLDEVVTTVTGEQRLRELGHVVGRINADSIVKAAPVSSLSELLNGRVPGLQVFTNSGMVGGEVSLQVRTPSSIRLSTAPIVIVDGIRYTSGTSGSSGGPFFVEPTSRLNDLNPNDIESIEVVKGPSAATLYGTDAANGVIVITTKRGQAGPARWNAYARTSLIEIPPQHYPESWWGWQSVNGVPSLTKNCALWLVAQGSCVQDSITVLPSPLNEPAQTIFTSKPRWEYGANVSGGRQDLRYYFSGDFEQATGPLQLPSAAVEALKAQRGVTELPAELLEPNAAGRMSLRANVSAVVSRTMELRFNTGYSRTFTRTLDLTSEDGVYMGGAHSSPLEPYGSSDGNPAEWFARTSTEDVDRLVGSAAGQWRPVGWLQARTTVGLDLANTTRYSLARPGESDFMNGSGQVEDERTRQLGVTADLGLTATARHGRLSFRTAIGAQYARTFFNMLTGGGVNLPPGSESVGQAATRYVFDGHSETVTLGSYLEETIGLNDRLFLTGALRVDGASAFGRDYEAAVYPKASVSWIISDEPLMPRLPGLDELRLRYAFGASGQQASSALALPDFGVRQALIDGAETNTIWLAGLGNPDLRPERVREHEFGFDVSGLAGHLRFDLTWFYRKAVDQIISRSLPPGYGNIFTNLGLVSGRGFEANLTAHMISTPQLSWQVSLGHSLRRSVLEDLGDASPSYSESGGYVEGYPLGARFIESYTYADVNGDGILGKDEVQFGDPLYRGESTAPYTQTLTTTAELFQRRLRVSALLERRSGFAQINAVKFAQCRGALLGGGAGGGCRAAVDPNTPLAEQAEVLAGGEFVHVAEPGDFTRFRELAVALELPAGLLRPVWLNSGSLSLAVRNLALWTDFSGPDPESATVSRFRGGMAEGIPQGRSWVFRLDLGF